MPGGSDSRTPARAAGRARAEVGATRPRGRVFDILERAAGAVGADLAAVLVADDGGQLRLASTWRYDPPEPVWAFDFAHAAVDIRTAWHESRTIFTPALTTNLAGPLALDPLACYLSVPVRYGDKPLPDGAGPSDGLLIAAWRKPRAAPTELERALLELAAQHVGMARWQAQARARLELAEHDARRMRDLYALLSQANQAIVRAHDPDQLLGAVCRAIAAYPGIGMAWIGWVDAATGSLRPAVWAGGPAAFTRGLRIRVHPGPDDGDGGGIASLALREGSIQVIADLTRLSGNRPNLRKAIAAGFRSWALIPVRHWGRQGLISLSALQPDFFQADDRRLLAELATDVEYGLDHLRTLTEREHGSTALRAVFDTVQDGLVLIDEHGRIEVANPGLAAMFGRPLTELVGQPISSLMTVGDRERTGPLLADGLGRITTGREPAQVVGQRGDGTIFPLELRVGRAKTPYGLRLAGVLRDRSRELQAVHELEHALTHDALTGLWNRAGLLSQLPALTGRQSAPTAGRTALLLIDVDDLQGINDAVGPDQADRLLVALARRLERLAGPHGLAARVGGDEFELVLPLDPLQAPGAWAGALVRRVGGRVRAAGRTHRVRVSAGVAIWPDDGPGVDALSARATLALRAAKADGGGAVRLFEPEMERREERMRALPDRLRAAIERGELVLYYQPQVNMISRQVRAFEALLRWQDPKRGLVAPGDFLPLLRDRDMIRFLGEWVIDTALSQWQAWHAQGIETRVAVNVAAPHFLEEGFAERVGRRLAGLGPTGRNALEVEITESAAIADTDRARSVMTRLAAHGVGMALDDFGTGYASIAYLSDLPFDTIKIDLSFTRHVLETTAGWAIAHAILLMGLSAEREVVAEGIETRAMEEGLLRLGTRFGQGFLFGVPMPAGEVPAWLERWRLDSLAATGAARRLLSTEADYMTAVQVHLRWVSRLLTVLHHPEAGARSAQPADASACAFTRWSDRYAEGRRSVARLARLHLASHAMVSRLMRQRAGDRAGDRAGAVASAVTKETERFLATALRAFYPPDCGGLVHEPKPARPVR